MNLSTYTPHARRTAERFLIARLPAIDVTPNAVRRAKRAAEDHGVRSLLTSYRSAHNGNPKIEKSNADNVERMTVCMHLAPADISGFNVCPWASKGCKAACLGITSGRAGIRRKGDYPLMRDGYFLDNPIIAARINRTLFYARQRAEFYVLLSHEISKAQRFARDSGRELSVRLNATSDISWEHTPIIDAFPDVQFYDYTKGAARAARFGAGQFPSNYHLTFSRSETNDADCIALLEAGVSVAVVFSGDLPDTWRGWPVFNANTTDERYLDPRGQVAGLTVKRNRTGTPYDDNGFIVRDRPIAEFRKAARSAYINARRAKLDALDDIAAEEIILV